MAHARRKFHELHANHKSQIAEEALKLFGVLCDVERQVQEFDIDARRAIRQQLGKPAADTFHAWLLAQRQRVPDGSATAKAIDYSLGRWGPLTHYLDDGAVPIDNNWVENHIWPIAIRRNHAQASIMLSCRQRCSVLPLRAVSAAVHNPRARRNLNSASVGWKRLCRVLSGAIAANARSFMPRSAST